ncbi:MAG TPA: hypothetical protein VFU71_05865 [Burkholderiaceae bacterium]|nr:hypothetical protein [Burkholderiaceae bacterium]
MSKTTIILGTTAVTGLLLAGCSHTTTREVVTPVPTAAAPPTVVVANATPPPAARVETPTPSPGYGYVWQAGRWTFRNGQYEWMPGHWESP